MLFISTSACGQKAKKSAEPVALDVKAFATAMVQNPGTVVDVRTSEEVARGKINGAIVIDFYEEDFKKQIKKLDKSKPVYLYCASGGRSADAADMLVNMGFTQVFNLDGGFRAWKAAGQPVVMP
ncbi:MAG TPA: rhodanese-like domain-containing protein [Bacteroidia bacterium]|nr:rhodanese-like domain-containing protein [Bacteroidia bacterium]